MRWSAASDVYTRPHLTSAVRGLMGEGVETSDLIWVFASSAALIAIFAPLTMRRYSRL